MGGRLDQFRKTLARIFAVTALTSMAASLDGQDAVTVYAAASEPSQAILGRRAQEIGLCHVKAELNACFCPVDVLTARPAG